MTTWWWFFYLDSIGKTSSGIHNIIIKNFRKKAKNSNKIKLPKATNPIHQIDQGKTISYRAKIMRLLERT
jgi:hypothetical protein